MVRIMWLVISFILLSCCLLSAEGESQIEGFIYDGLTGQPLASANIIINDGEFGVSADRYGYYSINLSHGIYKITARFVGYEPATAEIFLPPDTVISRNFYLVESSIVLEGVTVTARAPRIDHEPYTVTRTINVGAIERLSGVIQDPQRAVQTLTGVASNNELSAEFFIRGGNPDENLILFDNIPLIDPYYFTFDPRTSVSILNASLVDRAQLIQGNFPVRYGHALTSVLRMSSLSHRPQDYHVTLGLSLMQASAMFEGGSLEGISYSFSLRSSTPFHRIGFSHPFTDTEAWMYDAQGVIRLNDIRYGNHKLYILGGGDTYSGGFEGGSENVFIGTSSQYFVNSETAMRLFTGVQYRDHRTSGPVERIETRIISLYGRFEMEKLLTDNFTVTGGSALSVLPVRHDRAAPIPVESADRTVTNSGVYIEGLYRPFGEFFISPSLRLDYFSLMSNPVISGSITGGYQLNDRWLLRAGTGHYVQQPHFRGIARADFLGVSHRLRVQRTTNYTIGADGDLEDNASVRVELFYHSFDDVMVQTVGDGYRREYSGYNDGSGFARGFDFEFRIEDGRVQSWIGITMMQAHETDQRLGRGPYQRINSQTFTVNTVFEYNIGRGFIANLRAIYGRGFYYDDELEEMWTKYPDYRRIDVRMSKLFSNSLIYLDILNVWNIRNVAGGTGGFTPDWELGLPMVFNIGGEFRF